MFKIEVVWVYGASAAGKETFIRSVLGGNLTVLKEFDWQGKKLGTCQKSLEWIAQYPGDKVGEDKRHLLTSLIPALAGRYDVILVKGQDVDLSLGTPQKVRLLMPQAQHRIIFIDTGLDELFQRVVHKQWWDGMTRRAEEEGWLEEQIDKLMDLRLTFDFTTIDGRAIGHYEEVDFKGNFV